MYAAVIQTGLHSLHFVLSQPISYLGVWFENFSSTIVSFTLGPDSLAFLGHLATSPCVHLIMILMIVLILTDTAGLRIAI